MGHRGQSEKEMSVFHKFHGKIKLHSKEKQHLMTVLLIIRYQQRGSGLSLILCMDNKL